MDESVVKEFEQQQVGKLKLSAAIRAGCSLGPKARGSYWDHESYCALGAAWAFAVGTHVMPTQARLHKTFGVSKRILSKVATMNDEWGWSRERIADWLAAHGR